MNSQSQHLFRLFLFVAGAIIVLVAIGEFIIRILFALIGLYFMWSSRADAAVFFMNYVDTTRMRK